KYLLPAGDDGDCWVWYVQPMTRRLARAVVVLASLVTILAMVGPRAQAAPGPSRANTGGGVSVTSQYLGRSAVNSARLRGMISSDNASRVVRPASTRTLIAP